MTFFAMAIIGCKEVAEPAQHESPGAAATQEDAPRPEPWNAPQAQKAKPQPIDPNAPSIPSQLLAFNVGQDELDTPAVDAWSGETISSLLQSHVKTLVKALVHASNSQTPIDTTPFKKFVGSRFQGEALRPENISIAFRETGTTVRRMSSANENVKVDPEYQGIEGLKHALQALSSFRHSLTDVHSKVKLYRMQPLDPTSQTSSQRQYQTRMLITLSGHTAKGSSEFNAEWQARWRYNGKVAELESIRVVDHEEVIVENPQSTLFTDCTESLLGKLEIYKKQLLPAIHHWLPRTDISLEPDFEGMQGIAIGDADGDNLDDVYVCQGGGLPNRLLRQNQDGSVADISSQARVDFLETTRSALWIDWDNDGDQDLVLATDIGVVFLANDGSAHFTILRQWNEISLGFSLAASDFDQDGDLDVYVCRYFPASQKSVGQLPNPVPYHDANNGGSNVLLRNEGEGRFSDATLEVGLNENNQRWSYAASFEDYDNDGDFDLYVANDFGRNVLYRNTNGRFNNVAEAAGVEDIASGMSASWADYNRDGLMDLYVGNMFSSAGSRITYQQEFQDDAADTTKAHYQRLARGNSLFQNNGDGTFSDVSVASAVTMGRWSWGSRFVDFNNDGWEDLIINNGYITGNEDSGDL